MATNRKAAEAFILKYIEKILPGSNNVKMYEEMFAGMSDAKFDTFMADIEDGKTRLVIIAPNLQAQKLSTKRNLGIAEELGHNFFQRLWLKSPHLDAPYLTPIKYLVMQLPLRRQAQLLTKKISIPEDNKSVDDFSGQPTGKSQGSKLSYPELQILAALGLDANITEMIKFRGGDTKAFDAQNRQISESGGTSQKAIEHLGTVVKSTQTLSIYLKCMHLDNTLTSD